MKLLQEANLKGKRVFLRVDFNVPMKDGVIKDDNRIVAVLPTIKSIIDHGGKIILGAHLGRPKGQKNPELSLWPIANRLSELMDLKTSFSAPIAEYDLSDNLTMLENLRFDPWEEANDAEFAKELANKTITDDELGLYVNDAFAVSHRANASVEAITKFLPSYAGLLLQKEVENLTKIIENPEHPFVVIIGGVKVKDKAGVIAKLAEQADKILLGGGVANTFIKANGQNISNSVYDEDMLDACKAMLDKYKEKIMLPGDFVKEPDENGTFKILDIGGQARTDFANAIKAAKTVFWNGSLGDSEDSRYRGGMTSIAKAMNEVDGLTVIAGGDTVGFVKKAGLDKNISFISTGGGAALEFLAGEKLPGIRALER
ncbi:MAG: phosphoglycerate kinase [bacterium]|nr:phosphoglycerate kinase [bacterium]